MAVAWAGGAVALAANFGSTPVHAEVETVARIAVSFSVENVNTSSLSCSSDKKPYTISGDLVGPARLLESPEPNQPVTLYLHEFSFGRFFWEFGAVPGWDFVGELAGAGHVSLVVDRLGYDASGHPPGSDTCLGAQADVAAQLVRKLHTGSYARADGRRSPGFERVVLAGHSVGAGVAELAAHSFPDLGLVGLIVFGWADSDYSARSIEQSMRQGADCIPGGEPAETDGPSGYAYFGRTEAEFQQNVFHSAPPEVVATATAMRNRDPCGDNATLARIAVVNSLNLDKIAVPVLLVFGENDAVFQDGAAQNQAERFSGSAQVKLVTVPNAGHALTLEAPAAEVRGIVADWLGDRAPVAADQSTSDSRSAPAQPSAEPPATDPAPASSVEGVVVDGRASRGARTGGPVLPATGGVAPGLAAVFLGGSWVARRMASTRRFRPHARTRRDSVRRSGRTFPDS